MDYVSGLYFVRLSNEKTVEIENLLKISL